MLRIGMLLPRSSMFPSLGIDMLNGIKQYLRTENLFEEVKLITDNIGFGIDEQEIYTKAEKMLLQEDADAVILCADEKIAEMLQPLFTASNKLLLILNTGANFPDSWQPAPTTITHSLNFAFLAGMTGRLAAEETNKQILNVISYYDGGYRQCYCMLNSNQSNGGVPVHNYVTHLKTEEFNLEDVGNALKENKDAKTLLCLFSGEQVKEFYKHILPLQKKTDLSVYAAPMMFEPVFLNSSEREPIKNSKGFIPWSVSSQNENNKKFKEIFTADAANFFSLLGWEAGMILAEIIRFNNSNGTALVNHLKTISFETPRGSVKIDPSTHHTYGSAYLAEIRNNEIKVTATDHAEIEKEWQQYTKHLLNAGESSSWRNTYLCI